MLRAQPRSPESQAIGLAPRYGAPRTASSIRLLRPRAWSRRGFCGTRRSCSALPAAPGRAWAVPSCCTAAVLCSSRVPSRVSATSTACRFQWGCRVASRGVIFLFLGLVERRSPSAAGPHLRAQRTEHTLDVLLFHGISLLREGDALSLDLSSPLSHTTSGRALACLRVTEFP